MQIKNRLESRCWFLVEIQMQQQQQQQSRVQMMSSSASIVLLPSQANGRLPKHRHWLVQQLDTRIIGPTVWW